MSWTPEETPQTLDIPEEKRRHRRKALHRKKKSRKPLIGGLLALIIVIVLVVVFVTGGSKTPKSATGTTQAPLITAPAPSGGSSGSATPSSLPTSTVPATTTTTTTIPTTVAAEDPSNVLVEVFNGSGATNGATLAANALKAVGFIINGTGDEASFTYTTNVISYRPGNLAYAQSVANHIIGASKLVEDSSIPALNEVYLIVGTAYQGVK